MNRITIGFATLLGTIGAAAGVLIPMVGEMAGAAEPLGVSSQVWVTISAILAVVVVLGRMAQAVATTMTGQGDLDPGPEDLVDLEPTAPSDTRGPSA
ncbi:MAG: hypothetical protein RIB67_07415 [Miltoncostaeaceae bacterium]